MQKPPVKPVDPKAAAKVVDPKAAAKVDPKATSAKTPAAKMTEQQKKENLAKGLQKHSDNLKAGKVVAPARKPDSPATKANV